MTQRPSIAAIPPRAVAPRDGGGAGERSAARRFVLWFLVTLLALEWAYYWPFASDNARDRIVNAALQGYAAAVSVTLRTLGEPNRREQATIYGREAFRVTRECDAFQCKAALLAAAIAFPADWLRRAAVLAVGLIAIAGLNIARIVSLYYVRVFWPSAFDVFHHQIAQLVMIATTIGIFVLCVHFARPHPAVVAARPR